MPRFLTILLVGLTLPSVSWAQAWDQARYDALSVECGAFLERARATMDAGDARMAAVFIDLGWESCSQVRRLVRARWTEMTAEEQSVELAGVLASELALAELSVAAGACDRGASVLAEAFNLAGQVPDELTEAVARVSHAVLRCLPPGGLAEERRVLLGGDRSDVWLLGELWGFLFRGDVFSECPGRFPYPPSYRLRVLESGQLRSELQADGEWRLALEREGLVHCASGGAGLWGVDVVVEAGDWDVYVGYAGSRAPADSAYGIAFGLRPVGAPVTGPSHGVARLSGESRFASLRGHTLGESAASERFGSDCPGYLAEAPNHRLELSTDGEVVLRLSSAMSADLSLALAGPDTRACAAPGGAEGTELRLALSPGEYDVFVAEPSPWGTGYEIRFELETGELLPARLGTIELPGDGVSHVLAGLVPESPVAAERPDCAGLFHPAPDVTFELTEPGQWGVMVASSADTALALVGPSGTLCSRDWAGHNPGIFRPLEAGTYHVFVGTERATTERRFSLQIVRD